MRFPWLSRPRRVRYKPLIDVPFIGRDAILADLQQHAESVKAGQTCFVAIEGPSGSGKSSLLSEFVYLLGRSPDVLPVRVETGVGLMAAEFYLNVFDSLQSICERVLDKLYNDTKRFRKLISKGWDEQEFRAFLISTDWSQYQPATAPPRPVRGRTQSDPMRQLLGVVSQHPWAIASATALAFLSRPWPRGENHQLWSDHWAALLKILAASPKPSGGIFALLIDHLDIPADRLASQQWITHWEAFVAATQASGLPMLVIWSGSDETLLSLKHALAETETLKVCQLGEFEDGELQVFHQRLQRALPRALQAHWQTEADSVLNSSRLPGVMILCALQMAARSDDPTIIAPSLPISERATADVLVHNLVHLLRLAQADNEELLTQLLAIFAFWSPAKGFSLDDVLPYVDFVATGLDPFAGRAMIERLLGACVRYGLLKHDTFTSQFSTVSAQLQQALQELIEADPERRQLILSRRRLAALIIHCLQRGQEGLLEALASQVEVDTQAVPVDLAAYLTTPLCRMLLLIGKEERYRIAQALRSFPSPLAVTLLTTMLDDDDEQLRSRVAQSLA
ncbi:MAG: AAA family ATPase, partial [bacterium]|nr:AAA family ATPase [bacterium]